MKELPGAALSLARSGDPAGRTGMGTAFPPGPPPRPAGRPDLATLTGTPIDYLDFASPKPGLSGKLGIDATNKLPPETEREWGWPMATDPEVVARIDKLWPTLGLAPAPGASP